MNIENKWQPTESFTVQTKTVQLIKYIHKELSNFIDKFLKDKGKKKSKFIVIMERSRNNVIINMKIKEK